MAASGLAPVGGVAVGLLVDAAGTGAAKNGDVSTRAGLVFGGALVALALVDNLRPERRPYPRIDMSTLRPRDMSMTSSTRARR